jgi:predicted phosphoribosyltransferase
VDEQQFKPEHTSSNRDQTDATESFNFDEPPAFGTGSFDSPAYTADTHKQKRGLKDFFANKRVLLVSGATLAVVVLAAAAVFIPKKDPLPEAPQSNVSTVKKLGVAVGLTEGLVQYSADAKNWKDVHDDTELQEGDSIRTANDGRVVLLIDDGSAVRLDKESEVKLSRLTVESVVITNTSGEVYNRVVASETREYIVEVEDESYAAKGTAYRTFNESGKKGVEVFQSAVEAEQNKKEVPEGNYYFTKHDQVDKQGSVLALDIEALKADEFIKWNSEQDKKVANYANKLGILSELDKPAATPVPTAAPTPKTTAATGITLSGKTSEYSVVFSWKVSGVDTSKGYKLVRSSKTTSPTYPDNSVAYIEAGKTSYTLYVGDDTTYHYRLCAYREKTCDSYSNAVSVATLKKVKEPVVAGDVTLAATGNVLSWTFAGTAPYGFKVVVGTASNPSYGDNFKKYFTESTGYELPPSDFTPGTTYYVKVCKYSDAGCTDYSNEVTYTP